jgi:hypothetical protein
VSARESIHEPTYGLPSSGASGGLGTRTRVIDEAKAKIPTIDLADRLCGPGNMRRVGKPWAGKCPLPDHEDRSPSFTVYPENSSWYCYGCLRGGDVVDLAALAWGYGEDEMRGAAAHLLHEVGYGIPGRPRSWFAKRERQRDVRAAVEQVWRGVYQRRLYKYLILPGLGHIEDEEEYAREVRRTWHEFKELLQ